MFRTISILSFALLAVCSLSAAATPNDPFVGDWKLNPDKSKITDQMIVEQLDGNRCTFNFGSLPETIVLDGTDQPGIFGTTLAVSTEAPTQWKVVRKKDGHVLLIGIWSLSTDGSTLTDDFTSFRSDGTNNKVKYIYTRSGPGSGFTATWVGKPQTMSSPIVLQIRQYEEDGLSFGDSRGQDTNNVKFDGKEYPHAGPNTVSGYVSSAQRAADNAIELTDKVAGTLLRTRRLDLSSDLKTLTITVHSPGRTDPDIQVFERQ
jgi:hypothetical protein